MLSPALMAKAVARIAPVAEAVAGFEGMPPAGMEGVLGLGDGSGRFHLCEGG